MLRAGWLAGRVTGAVVLVLRQGLLAWVRADPCCEPIAPVGRNSADGSPRSAVVDRRLVAAFVELILNRRPEGPSCTPRDRK
jgi:hypothetical protein